MHKKYFKKALIFSLHKKPRNFYRLNFSLPKRKSYFKQPKFSLPKNPIFNPPNFHYPKKSYSKARFFPPKILFQTSIFRARILPSQKIGSTASTEPLYYNTELLNPQEAHFRQLAVMWTTYSSAYPQYYTPVNLTTSMTV
jgi:hypothetical protein